MGSLLDWKILEQRSWRLCNLCYTRLKMYLGIDIGGTKTIVATLDDDGVIQEKYRFPTPQKYADFLKELESNVEKLSTKEFRACGVGAPGKIDRARGVALAFGNLDWKNAALQKDVQAIVKCPVVVDNDANLAGLSEAMLRKDREKVLYVTISTGIGTGFIVKRRIDPELADSEGGQMLLEHHGKLEPWEDFASGRAIVRRFDKRASEINDARTWRIIAHNIALGLIDFVALMQPDVIVLGGGVSAHYDKFKDFLAADLKSYENPLFKIPAIEEAVRPELAVVYGCYDLAKSVYGKIA